MGYILFWATEWESSQHMGGSFGGGVVRGGWGGLGGPLHLDDDAQRPQG